jgi:hypothetical protein
MDGGAVVRRCHDCSCDVVNLSSLDELTARALLEQQTAPACVSYRYQRGKIVFAKTRRTLAMAAAAAVLLAAVPGGADTSKPSPAPQRRREKRHAKKPAPPAPSPKKPEDDLDDGGLLFPSNF